MAGGVASTAGAGPRGARMVPLGEMTGNVELLFGHPDSAGLFVMRIAELAGSVIPPHSHPSDEHITVLQGTFYFAVGERYDSTALRELKAGSYAFVPAGATMFGHTPEGAVVQVHAIGPFSIQWRDSTKMLGEPGAAAVFRFRKGDQVSTPRGEGRIREGYAAGPIVQYEIEGAGGRRFMAHERDLRRP